MTTDELFQRLRFSSKVLTGVLMIAVGGVGFGLVAIVRGMSGMPDVVRTTALCFVVYGGTSVLIELGFLGFELHARRRARQLLRAGDHDRAARWVLRVLRSTASDLGDSDPQTMRWQITYAQVVAHQGWIVRAERLVLDIAERRVGPIPPSLSRAAVAGIVQGFRSRPVEIWWPELDVRELGRRIAQSRAVLVLYAAMVVGALAVGIAVLVGGVEAVPSWMRSLAVGVGVAVALVVVQVLQQVWVDRSLVRQVGKLLAIGDHAGAARNVGIIVDQRLARPVENDVDLLRWSITLTHLQLILGQDLDALEMLSVLRTEQQRLMGPMHPDVARTERVMAAAVAGTAASTPVERWWR